MAPGLNVVMLLTDGFGGRGGIAKFNRDFLQALDGSPLIKRVRVFPRLIPARIEEEIPESVVYDRIAAKGRIAFLRRLAGCALRKEQTDLVICGHLHLLPLAWLLARVCGVRLALIIHGIEAWGLPDKVLVNRLGSRVDGFIAVSEFSAQKFASWSKVPIERGFILPNCVDLEIFRPQPRDPALQQRYGLQASKVILTVGRMEAKERYKGFDEVLKQMPRLLQRYPDLKYLVVGDGSDRARLEAKSKALGVSEHVVFAGQIPEAEKVAHYNLADVYAMPSTGEGFGIVLIEAAACGIPVVGSRSDGSREALLQGSLGRLVDPKNASELLDAISSALGDGSERQRKQGVERFGVSSFRSRVAKWVAQQAVLTSTSAMAGSSH